MYAPQLLLTMEDPTDVPLPPFQERQPCVGHRLLHVLGLCATDGVLPGGLKLREIQCHHSKQTLNLIVSVQGLGLGCFLSG